MMETVWLYVFLGVILGLFVRNTWYTYQKVSKEGKKFDWSYVVTGIFTAIFTAWGLMTASEHIVIPDYILEKGWWAVIAMGFMIGIGGNDILNAILKLLKKEKEVEQIQQNSG